MTQHSPIPSPPRRRVRADIQAHADDREALTRMLHEIADRLSGSDFDPDVVSTEGGKDAGFTLHLSVDDSMTPQRYRAEQRAWWEATAAAATAARTEAGQ